ncbi:hypothetical protein HFN92_08355 [Rhizobium laguerreae]|nr:hypothetical protein [Rhizobium laguerreae]
MTSILTNLSAMSAFQALRTVSGKLQKTQIQVSTGLHVATASDNAAYWSIATTMRSDQRAVSAANDALGVGAAKVDTAYTALSSIVDVLSEFKAKLVAAKEPGIDLSKVQDELDQLKDQVVSISKSASFNGQNWLDTNVEDIYDTDTNSVSVVSAFTRNPNGAVSVNTMDFSLLQAPLFNSTGGGMLQADPRDLKSIGGLRFAFNSGLMSTYALRNTGGGGRATHVRLLVAPDLRRQRQHLLRRDRRRGQSGRRDNCAIRPRPDDFHRDRQQRCQQRPRPHGWDDIGLQGVRRRPPFRPGGIGTHRDHLYAVGSARTDDDKVRPPRCRGHRPQRPRHQGRVVHADLQRLLHRSGGRQPDRKPRRRVRHASVVHDVRLRAVHSLRRRRREHAAQGRRRLLEPFLRQGLRQPDPRSDERQGRDVRPDGDADGRGDRTAGRHRRGHQPWNGDPQDGSARRPQGRRKERDRHLRHQRQHRTRADDELRGRRRGSEPGDDRRLYRLHRDGDGEGRGRGCGARIATIPDRDAVELREDDDGHDREGRRAAGRYRHGGGIRKARRHPDAAAARDPGTSDRQFTATSYSKPVPVEWHLGACNIAPSCRHWQAFATCSELATICTTSLAHRLPF